MRATHREHTERLPLSGVLRSGSNLLRHRWLAPLRVSTANHSFVGQITKHENTIKFVIMSTIVQKCVDAFPTTKHAQASDCLNLPLLVLHRHRSREGASGRAGRRRINLDTRPTHCKHPESLDKGNHLISRASLSISKAEDRPSPRLAWAYPSRYTSASPPSPLNLRNHQPLLEKRKFGQSIASAPLVDTCLPLRVYWL